MNGQFYFEEHPWKHVCSLIAQNGEQVEQVIVQCVCKRGQLNRIADEWKERVSLLTGPEQEGEMQRSEKAFLYIGVFGEGTVVRFFFDEAAGDVCENFEIVTNQSLIVWKPLSVSQGHMLFSDRGFIECNQRYVEELADGPAKEIWA